MTIYKEFTFDAAHRLPNVPDNHKCYHLHGHTYRLIVYLTGEPGEETGWLMDYADIQKAVQQAILNRLDHKYLNDVLGLSNPTTEALAPWIWNHLRSDIPADLALRVEVKESATTGCIYGEAK